MDVRKIFLTCIAVALLSADLLSVVAFAQSGNTYNNGGARGEYGVNLTVAIFQYDPQRSAAIEEVTHLSGTYSTAEEELGYIKDKQKLDDMAVRHVRAVGLRSNETFNDAVLLGPEYMTVAVTPVEVIRGFMKLDIRVRYANQPLLDMKNIEFENFETVLLRGGKGMFGAKYYVGAGGAQQSAPIERTLLVSVTPQIVPVANLQNRPQQLSHPVDEFGAPVAMKESDRFTPPVPLDRVVPKFDSGRPVRGSVLLAGVVTPEGKITNIRAVRSLDPVIDDRAIDAFRQYKFSPALLNGKPIYATYREEISFGLTPEQQQLEEERRREQENGNKPKTQQTPKRRFPFPVP